MKRERLRILLLSQTPESGLASAGVLVARLLFGLSMAFTHGRGTMEALLRGRTSFPDPLGLGSGVSMALMGFAEFFCALLVAAGLLCRAALVPLVFGLGVAALIHHHGNPFHERELALLYFGAFAALLLVGPGRYSLDRLLLGSRAPLVALALLTAAPLPADPLHDGLAAMRRARAALGPPRAIALVGEGTFDPAAQLQGFTPASRDAVPFREEIALTDDGRVGYESRYTRRDGTEEWLRFAWSGDRMQFVQMTERFAALVIDEGAADNAARVTRMLPQVLVDDALANAASIRLAGSSGSGASRVDRVAFALDDGELLTLSIDGRGLVRGFDYYVDLPLLGDTRVEWVYDGYSRTGDSMLPAGYTIHVADRELKRVRWRRAETNAGASAVFEIPDGVAAPPPPPPRDAAAAPAPPAPRVVQRAPGVWQVQRLRSGFHPMFVDTGDFVVAFEAPTGWLELHQVPASNFVAGATSGSVSEEFIRLIRETVPSKPIRYLVLSHFHNDHSGGVRAFVAEGTTIVTTPVGREVLERALRRPHAIVNDRLQRNPRRATFEIVEGTHVIRGRERNVELIEVPNAHAAGMLVSWVPSEKLLFVADLFLPLGKSFPSRSELPMNLAFAEWLDRSGLDPQILLAIHGISRGTNEQLDTLRRMNREAKAGVRDHTQD